MTCTKHTLRCRFKKTASNTMERSKSKCGFLCHIFVRSSAVRLLSFHRQTTNGEHPSLPMILHVKSIRTLWVSSVHVTSMSPSLPMIIHVKSIRTLWVSYVHVTSMSPSLPMILHVKSIRTLWVSSVHVTSMSPSDDNARTFVIVVCPKKVFLHISILRCLRYFNWHG